MKNLIEPQDMLSCEPLGDDIEWIKWKSKLCKAYYLSDTIQLHCTFLKRHSGFHFDGHSGIFWVSKDKYQAIREKIKLKYGSENE